MTNRSNMAPTPKQSDSARHSIRKACVSRLRNFLFCSFGALSLDGITIDVNRLNAYIMSLTDVRW